MKAKFVVLSGAKSDSFIIRLPTVIGRSQNAKVKLRSSRVSRQHCELYEYEGQIAVKDLDSSNGTLVNGVKIDSPTLLTPHDTLEVGPVSVQILVHNETRPKGLETTLVTDGSALRDTAADSTPPHDAGPDSAQTTPATASAESDADCLATGRISKTQETDESPDESVVDYTESASESFVGIEELGEVGAQSSRPTNSDVLGELPVEDGPSVSTDDSALNSFFRKFE